MTLGRLVRESVVDGELVLEGRLRFRHASLSVYLDRHNILAQLTLEQCGGLWVMTPCSKKSTCNF